MCARSFNSTLFGWLVHMVFEGDTHEGACQRQSASELVMSVVEWSFVIYPIIEASGWEKGPWVGWGSIVYWLLLRVSSPTTPKILGLLLLFITSNFWVLNISPSSPPKKHENFYKLLPTTNFVFKKWDLLWRE
jgi:hypothetical protein